MNSLEIIQTTLEDFNQKEKPAIVSANNDLLNSFIENNREEEYNKQINSK